jgi:CRP-like cAMP-binding protein
MDREMARRESRTEGSILSTATQELRWAIEATAVRTSLGAGNVLFSQGDAGDAFYVIERGQIEISVHSLDGRKLVLGILCEGEVLGEIALFGGNRMATATALGDCELRRIRRVEVMAALRRRPELAFEFIDVLCERLRALSGTLEERAFLPVPVRLANRLLYLDSKLSDARGSVTVSQADLADFVGATRETVARTLAVWRSCKWIALSRGSIRILEHAALESIGAAFRD